MSAIGVDRAGAANADLAAAQQQVDTAVKATLGGQKLAKITSLSQALQDFSEEVSFGHGERVESDDLADDAVEDRGNKMREQLIQKVQEAYKGSEAGDDQREKLQRLLQKSSRSDYGGEDLLEDLQEGGGDRGEIFAALLEMEGRAEPGSRQAAVVKEAIEAAAGRWEHQLLAAANTLEDAVRFSERSGLEQSKLQRSYQDSVVEYSSVIGSLATLAREYDADQLETGVEFLQQASLADLAAMPPSVDKERLNQTILELQGVKVMHTITEGVQTSWERAAGTDPRLAGIDRDWLLRRFLTSLDNPNDFELSIKKTVDASDDKQSKVLLLQDLKQLISDIPEHYFRSEQKPRSISPWQREIDRLVEIEAEEA